MTKIGDSVFVQGVWYGRAHELIVTGETSRSWIVGHGADQKSYAKRSWPQAGEIYLTRAEHTAFVAESAARVGLLTQAREQLGKYGLTTSQLRRVIEILDEGKRA